MGELKEKVRGKIPYFLGIVGVSYLCWKIFKVNAIAGIIAFVVILALIVFAFWYFGGGAGRGKGKIPVGPQAQD